MLRDPEGYWTGFSARMRVIAYNTKLVPEGEAPRSVLDLADPDGRGKRRLLTPGSAQHRFMWPRYTVLGDEKADDFFRRLEPTA